jgi:biotin transport system substrate-specific component
MGVNAYVSRYRNARQAFYEWQGSTETVYKLGLALIFACLTGLGAFVRVYTPLSPVPFTAQVLVVLLSGAVLGSVYGGISQLMYVAIGAMGVPWFAGGTGGLEYVMGATGGYLMGFILAAVAIGYIAERYVEARTVAGMLPLMMLGVAIIYGMGAMWLAIVMDLGVGQAIVLGVLPFILLDVIKAVIAAGVGRVVTTRAPIGTLSGR